MDEMMELIISGSPDEWPEDLDLAARRFVVAESVADTLDALERRTALFEGRDTNIRVLLTQHMRRIALRQIVAQPDEGLVDLDLLFGTSDEGVAYSVYSAAIDDALLSLTAIGLIEEAPQRIEERPTYYLAGQWGRTVETLTA